MISQPSQMTQPSYVELPSGLCVPEAAKRRRPTCVDLFCGCGGFSLGMIAGGFEVVAACDNDPWAAITYLTNLGSYPVNIHWIEPDDKERLNKACEKLIVKGDGVWTMTATSGSGRIAHEDGQPGVGHFFFGDVRKLTGRQILDAVGMERGELDCVVGGPPCQGFTRINSKRSPTDPRNSLVFEFIRLVIEMQPKTMIMENVPDMLQMVTPEGVPVLDAICRVLEDGGFGVYDSLRRSLLASSGCGAAIRAKAGKKRKTKRKKQKRLFAEQT